MGKKNTMRLETKGIGFLLADLDKAGGNVRAATTYALKRAAQQICWDTEKEVHSMQGFPAQGKYSHGDTGRSILSQPSVEWEGNVASISVGFNYDKPGAGGFLIEGTPRMAPDPTLRKMYKGKSYREKIIGLMQKVVLLGTFNNINDALIDDILNIRM